VKLPAINSWPAAIVALGLLALLGVGIYLDWGSPTVRHLVEQVVAAALVMVLAQLRPALGSAAGDGPPRVVGKTIHGDEIHGP